ncbi:MAG: TadE/TadG family type IV pilus assembly protein [Acetobacteraceae bacterium]
MIRIARHRLRADRRGETALEFALVGGVFFLLLLAPIELGLMIWTGSALQQVAAQTARCVAIGSSQCTSPQTYAVGLASKWVGSNAINSNSVTAAHTPTCNNATGNFEKVTITSSIWAGAFISPLAGTTQVATACFPL